MAREDWNETQLGLVERMRKAFEHWLTKNSWSEEGPYKKDIPRLRRTVEASLTWLNLYESQDHPGVKFLVILNDQYPARSGQLTLPTEEECSSRDSNQMENRLIRMFIHAGFELYGFCVFPQDQNPNSCAEPYYIVVVKMP